jgi:hypothetical protein
VAFTIALVLLALPSSILGAADQTRASAPATLRIYLARNQAILQILLGLSLDDTRSITQANDELYLIELDGTGAPRLWKLVTAANLRDL